MYLAQCWNQIEFGEYFLLFVKKDTEKSVSKYLDQKKKGNKDAV